MQFEYDQYKSKINQEKHGISLEEARRMWFISAVEVDAQSRFDEQRHMLIGKLSGKLYSVIFTMRGETIRLISARRSSKREVKIYHETIV